MEITSLSQLDLDKTYTYADYLTWKILDRVELLRGKIMKMSPAPSRYHQQISQIINSELYQYFKNQHCQVFYAPFDVRLERFIDDRKVSNVVQPDICVVCDLSKLDDRGCSGAPELIVEILSPGNTKKEMKYKFELYEEAKVKEYWIVDPTEKIVLQYTLINGQFTNYRPLIEEDILISTTFPDISIDLKSVFEGE